MISDLCDRGACETCFEDELDACSHECHDPTDCLAGIGRITTEQPSTGGARQAADPATGSSPVSRRAVRAAVPDGPAVPGSPSGTAGGTTSPAARPPLPPRAFTGPRAAGDPLDRETGPVPAGRPSLPGSVCVEPAEPGTTTPAGAGQRRAAGAAPAGPAVTRLASLPPWPAPPDPADVLLQIRLSLPPVTESRARISPAEYTRIGGVKVKTKKAHGYKEPALAKYQEAVGWLLRGCRVTRNDTDELGVYGIFHLPKGAGAADGDNLLKAVTDAGNGIAWKDDRQFVRWAADVFRGSRDPHTDLVVYVARHTEVEAATGGAA